MVNFERGIVFAPAGRIELGGLSTAGTIGINSDSSLSFPESIARGNVSLSDNSIVSVFSGGGGSIAINSKNLELTEGSGLLVGIAVGLGNQNAQAGNLIVNVTDLVSLRDSSQLSNINYGQGKAGDVEINAGSIDLSNGSFISSSTFRVGNAGNVNITAKSVKASNGGSIAASTFGQGDAGNVIINTDDIALDGVGINGFSSGVFSNVESGGIGKGGNINVRANSVQANNGGVISSSTLGQGDAGKVNINADF